ncbi:hypothetical protein C8F04DRAFT_1263507 [Mycena alexandri]|uniref:Uncharacterized protein n=1 Tax=Mycena alexandri TaxID=1745969 RepID=A0AAD6SN60_9AGAR|nr:hypothetical protein C8F04DRAFT_1263507 [Mycena alexandri]
MERSDLDLDSFYQGQTVFLTGATGGLGGCLLFKLVIPVDTENYLPDGPIEERTYDLGDPEAQLAEIQATGTLSGFDIAAFASSYNLAKDLGERLDLLPILIVRPTIISPATAPDSGVFWVAPGDTDGRNVIDELPVNFVGNLILLDAARGTVGIVHATAQSYVPRTMAHLEADICAVQPAAKFAGAVLYSHG